VSFFGDTISNCDTSKLGRLSYESIDFRPKPFRGGDAVWKGDKTRGGDEADEDDMLGRPFPESRLSPELLSVTWDCRLADRDCDICCANCSGIAGLGGMSLTLPFKVVLDAIEFLITDVAMSRTLGRRFRVPSDDCSALERGVPLDDGGREDMLDLEPCSTPDDFQDLRMDFRTPLLLSGLELCETDGGRCAA